MWSRESGALHDPFHLVFIHKALQDVPWMKCAVFGLDSHTYSLPSDGPGHNDPISELFNGYSESWYIYISDGAVFILQFTDKTLLLKASTFLDPDRLFTKEPNDLNAWIDVRYYPKLSLWTPCPCFPVNSYPCVFLLSSVMNVFVNR